MSECNNYECIASRRAFLSKAAYGLGAVSLASFFNPALLANVVSRTDRKLGKGALGFPHFSPKAKRVIYMFQSGAPSQLDLFDYKPLLNEKSLTEKFEVVQQLVSLLTDCANGKMRVTQIKEFIDNLY